MTGFVSSRLSAKLLHGAYRTTLKKIGDHLCYTIEVVVSDSCLKGKNVSGSVLL